MQFVAIALLIFAVHQKSSVETLLATSARSSRSILPDELCRSLLWREVGNSSKLSHYREVRSASETPCLYPDPPFDALPLRQPTRFAWRPVLDRANVRNRERVISNEAVLKKYRG